MKTPKKTSAKKSAPTAKKNSVLKSKQDNPDEAFMSNENDDDFDLPMNDLDDLGGLDPLDDDDDDDF